MKRQKTVTAFGYFKYAILAILVAAIALLTMPIGAIGSRAAAEEPTEEKAFAPARTEARAGGSVEVTVNYYRSGGDYTGWNLWMWVKGGDGGAHQFDKEITVASKTGNNKWKSFTVTLNNVPDSGEAIGFIVRKSESGSEWAAKDPDADRFIDADKIVNGKVTIYCVSEQSTFYYDEDSIFRPLFSFAKFSTEKKVYVATTNPINDKQIFKVKDSDGQVVAKLDCTEKTGDKPSEAAGKAIGKTYFYLDLDNNASVDFSKDYTVYDEPTAAADPDKNIPTPVSVGKTGLYGTTAFNNMYKYTGTLGAEYSKTSTKFTVWAPFATSVKLNLYAAGDGTAAAYSVVDMTKGEKGSWSTTVSGDLNKKYYTYEVDNNGTVSKDVVDPYARTGGLNGKRGMVIDLASTNPEGWSTQQAPEHTSYSDAIIYEAHVRDLTIHQSSNVSENNRGKFLGLTEKGSGATKTALDRIKELGVTEVHFLPFFDFATVDEALTTPKSHYDAANEFNWGYDPLNYNMPEGSYSTDAKNGEVRVKELKQMIMALHNEGIRVIMDVVYNHVSGAADSNFEALAPGYYFRLNGQGAYTNGSGCGNETASEHYMFSRFMIDSVKYWSQEYKIDGFRFDLMALHDVDTMNAIYDEVSALDEDVMIYGEGWTGGSSGMADTVKPAKQANAEDMPNIAFFNDVIRDTVKGGVFDMKETGYVGGKKNSDPAIYIGAVGCTGNSKVGYSAVGKSAYATNPTQSINYVSCHDNSTLWDKLNASVEADTEALKAMNRMAAAAVLTSQGPAFFLAGEEMMRSKPTTKTNTYDNRATAYLNDDTYYFSDNSYKSPDSVNAIDWGKADTNSDMVDYYKALIAIRKAYPQFHLSKKSDIAKYVTINDSDFGDGVSVYAIKNPKANSNEHVVVAFNNNATSKTVSIPSADYAVLVSGDKATADKANPLSTVKGGKLTIGARSAMILVGDVSADVVKAWTYSLDSGSESSSSLALGLGIGIPAGIIVVGGVVVLVLFMLKKKKGGDKTEAKEEAPAEEASEEAPVEEAPEEEAPVEEAPAEEAPADDAE